jgi:maltooligosyltrehalose trehalohydrolase
LPPSIGLPPQAEMSNEMQRNSDFFQQGALRQPDESVLWRVWAPLSKNVSLILSTSGKCDKFAMTLEDNGHFIYQLPQIAEGVNYTFGLDDGHEYPDPASRWQPHGVHRPSAVFFPKIYTWSDASWRGVARDELVIYELHVGTFTPEGTFDAIIPRLSQLRSLGVTAIELMPVAQFAGDRNWGYDAVYPYAVQNSYGGPRALQRLVDAAHQAGLAVLLDVIYNHLGPEGNYLGKYGPYFTDQYRTPWGMAVNYDGAGCDAVRQFVIDNACMWVRDYHVDGLRLDAVHAIYDLSPRHILADIHAAVQREATQANRLVHVIAETNQNDVRLIRPRDRGGYGLDGVWNDDFHHSIHSFLTGEREGYYQDYGEAADIAKTFNDVFVYDGRYSRFRQRHHGTRVKAIDRARFVVCIQNHDQIGNRACGDRFTTLVEPAAQRLAAGLLLLSPCVPLLFMGEEYGEKKPFPFFCSFDDPSLIEAVRRGRREEFAALAFKWGTDIPDPQSPETFASAKLAWAWPAGSTNAQHRQLYQDLLTARRSWPALRDRRHTRAKLLNSSDVNLSDLLVIQRGGDDGLLVVANLSAEKTSTAALELSGKKLMLSTEDTRYGGNRLANQTLEYIFPRELLIFSGSGGQQ